MDAVVAASIWGARQAGTVLTVRKLYEDIVRARYPHHQPQNDFELFVLASSNYSRVLPGQLSECLAREWSYFVSLQDNDPEVAMASIRTQLAKTAEVTGVSHPLYQV